MAGNGARSWRQWTRTVKIAPPASTAAVVVGRVCSVGCVGGGGLLLPRLSPAGECWTLTTVRKVT